MPQSDSFLLQIIIATWAVSFAAYFASLQHDRRQPVDHIGLLWLLGFNLYFTVPPIIWLYLGPSRKNSELRSHPRGG